MLPIIRLIVARGLLSSLLFCFVLGQLNVAGQSRAAGPMAPEFAAVNYATSDDVPLAAPLAPAYSTSAYKWNIDDHQSPLLAFAGERVSEGLERVLTFPGEAFDFPIFKPLTLDEQHEKYVLPIISKATHSLHFVEFAPTGSPKTYTSIDGSNIEYVDRDSLKTFRTAENTRFIFVRFPDGEFRCATIKTAGGATLHLIYAAKGVVPHRVVDSLGRSVTFNYEKDGINSITQTWIAHAEDLTRTWIIGVSLEDGKQGAIEHAHSVAIALKALPPNAVVLEYTAEMAASDKLLAEIFGGPGAVVAANGFEPSALASQYPLYRGDIIGDDGKLRRGHLSSAMHIYGSPDGRAESALFVPPGFTSHSSEASPTDAAVTFYYPRLGNLTDVTLAVYHVADFKLVYEKDRVRIGKIGGLGGCSPLYKHSHIEFYRGNTSLPPASARASLRIEPALVFGKR